MTVNLQQLVDEEQEQLVRLLHDNGLSFLSDFQVKIRELHNDHDLATYRGGSVFMSKAIFWLSENFYYTVEENYIMATYDEDEENILREVKKELHKTLAHEMGHAVADFLRLLTRIAKDPEKTQMVRTAIGVEEDFAENFIQVLDSQQFQNQIYYSFYEEMVAQLSARN